MTIEHRRTEWVAQQALPGESREIVWIRSIGGSLLGTLLGLSNMTIVQRFLPDLLGAVLAVAVGGVIAGAVQGGFMRRYTRPALVWLAITAISWVSAFIALQMPDWTQPLAFDAFPWRSALLCASVISVPQWWMLRRHVGRAWCWVMISIGCWCVVLVFLSIFYV